MSHSSNIDRQRVCKPMTWGLHPVPAQSESKALQGTVRTRYGFVQVISVKEGTFLDIVVHDWHYSRRTSSGPIQAKSLVVLANKFAHEVHLEASKP